MPAICTIGHSNHAFPRFMDLLKMHHIEVVVDVRSMPWSKLYPHFRREALAATLPNHGKEYIFMGNALGGRSNDPSCLVRGRVSYAALAVSGPFQRGIFRVINAAQNRHLALMCSEQEPTDCHRTILVGRHLVQRGCEVNHILKSGDVETHAAAIQRLRTRLGINTNLFLGTDDLDAKAYEEQENCIAWRVPT